MAPYEGAIKAIAYLLLVVAIGAGLYALHDSVYQSGVSAERVKWQTKLNKEIADANTKYAALVDKYRKQEQQEIKEKAVIAESYRKERMENDRKKDAVIAGLRNRTIVLRDPGSTQGCRSGTAEVAPGATGSDGQAGAELSPELSGFLVSEASRADAVVRQLTACQEVVESDRN